MSAPNELKFTAVVKLEEVVRSLRSTFASGVTRDIAWREKQIRQVGLMVQDNEDAFYAALKQDLGKPKTEAFVSELNLVIADCKELVSKLSKWSKPEAAATDLMWAATRPKMLKEPKGTVLIIGPFNYPVSLTLVPLMGAIAGGNTVMLKPSEQSPTVAQLLTQLLPAYLDSTCFAIVNGAKEQMTKLLELRWDHIFFTGSSNVGKIVAQAAAKQLTPVTLELGGKSPVIVLDDAKVDTAARRIIWGKHINAGQSCIAPDYILCSKEMQPKLIEGFRKALKHFYPDGRSPLQADSYGRLVNSAAHDRVTSLLDNTQGQVVIGGDNKEKQVDITVVADVQLDDPLMQSELFAPIMPIMICESIEKAVEYVNLGESPLALYIFGSNSRDVKYITEHTQSGAVVQNDVMTQGAIQGLYIGGVGGSGYGNYHGRRTFDTFVYERAVVNIPNYLEPALSLRYPPYTANRLKWLRRMTAQKIRGTSSIPKIPMFLLVSAVIHWLRRYLLGR